MQLRVICAFQQSAPLPYFPVLAHIYSRCHYCIGFLNLYRLTYDVILLTCTHIPFSDQTLEVVLGMFLF